MKLTYVFQISKNMLPTKNGINTTNILYTGSYKSVPILWGKIFKMYFNQDMLINDPIITDICFAFQIKRMFLF